MGPSNRFSSQLCLTLSFSSLSFHCPSYVLTEAQMKVFPLHWQLVVSYNLLLQVVLFLSLMLRQLYTHFIRMFSNIYIYIFIYMFIFGWARMDVVSGFLGGCGDCSSCSFFQLISFPVLASSFSLLYVGV